MDTISRGQITVVDLNDGKAMNMYLNSSRPTTQIYNNDTKSYVPSWAASPYLVITPELSVTGATTNQMSRLKTAPTWKINGSTTLANFGATVATTAPYAITVKNNLNAAQWTFECSGIYVDPDNGAETAVKASITFSKADTAGAPIRAIGYAPDGTIFQNNKVATLKAHCDLWRGSSIDSTNVLYTWQKLVNGVWTNITSTNANGIAGYNTNEITIPNSAILNFDSFKCLIKDTDSTSGTYNTTVSDIISFADLSDPYVTEITADKGNILTSGLTSTTLRADVWQGGVNLSDTSAKASAFTFTWKKYKKDGTLDTSWGTSGSKTGQTITVAKSEIVVSSQFICEVSK